MKTKIAISSLLACAVASPGIVLAQEEGVIEEIVVTGSLIRGTPEDAALPVEVHTAEDMQLSGAPSALEFAKSLTSSGPTTGEAYYFGGADLTGNVQYNLRGIGADKTLVLFNGRRINENTSLIPSIITSRIEVLKDGAAVTYGADATGGVVNFIPKESYEGIEMTASYKTIDGSDGDYNIGLMGGFGGEDTNVMWAIEWDHRSELSTTDRDFTSQGYGTNPAPWSTLTNVARYFVHGPLPEFNIAPLGGVRPVTNSLGGFGQPDGEYGNLLGVVADFDQASCESHGGVFVPGPSPSQSCNYNYIPYYKLVEDQDIFRLYGQVTTSVTDTMDFYLRTAYSEVDLPHSYGSPSQPVVRGPARHNGLVAQFYVPRLNPFFDEFASRSGLDTSATYGLVNGVTAITYRAFAHGGNDNFASDGNFSTPREINNRYFHLSTGLDGEWDNGIGYDFGLTLNRSESYNTNPDILAFRLQEALNGFGGPNCNAVDNDPFRYGTQRSTPPVADNPLTPTVDESAPGIPDDGVRPAGCMWFNPFASTFAGQPVLGLTNDSYGGSTFENSSELERWLFDKREQTTVTHDFTIDFVINGETPIELPGGNIGWGAGIQLRNRYSEETVPSDFYNGNQPCQWAASEGQEPLPSNDPDFTSCGDGNPGPFQFFGINPPDSLRQDQRSAFAEFSLPVLDSLYFGAALRYEEFSGGLDTTVYKLSGQWQISDNLSVRGSYGTNYQAPGIAVTPGSVVNGVNSYTIAGNNWLGATTVTRSDIEPETATVWSFGTIWESQGFTDDSDFRLIVDYFSIETEDELGLLATANDIAASVFNIPGIGTGPRYADCSHALIDRVTLNAPCVQFTGIDTSGATPVAIPANATTARDFASITTEFGNGPSQLTTGFDIQMNYSFPFMEGDLSFGLTATLIKELESSASIIDGFAVDNGDDRLGDLNFAVVAGAASEWRTNLNVNYSQDIHNVRAVINYVSGVDDERFINADGSLRLTGTGGLTPAGYQTGTTNAFEASTYGVRGDDWVTLDVHYTADFEFATVSASIANLADENPPESRQELGYDPRIGNPLGRTFELGIRKEF